MGHQFTTESAQLIAKHTADALRKPVKTLARTRAQHRPLSSAPSSYAGSFAVTAGSTTTTVNISGGYVYLPDGPVWVSSTTGLSVGSSEFVGLKMTHPSASWVISFAPYADVSWPSEDLELRFFLAKLTISEGAVTGISQLQYGDIIPTGWMM